MADPILDYVIALVLAPPAPSPDPHPCEEPGCPDDLCHKSCPVCACHRPYCACV